MLVLASSSPYRRILLERLQLPYTVASPDIDEAPLPDESPEETALRLAESKARAVAGTAPGRLVIGSDQVAALDGAALGKPGTHERALAQLLAMRGRSVIFHTAVCLLEVSSGVCQVDEVPTTVLFRRYSDAQAASYLERERPYDCAGSAKVEALGIALIEQVVSTDPTAIIGLPLIALVTMLKRCGVEVL